MNPSKSPARRSRFRPSRLLTDGVRQLLATQPPARRNDLANERDLLGREYFSTESIAAHLDCHLPAFSGA